jgi:formylglycine-generating enzyme required for sulfatase activity/uncharacterized protein YjbI with pentapeptide repeats/alpha-tubulin suppressor-like RCC1 family protein/N-acetylneuraminic acid mutarotase
MIFISHNMCKIRVISVSLFVGFFFLSDAKGNNPPSDLNSTAVLTIAENQPIGTVVGEFNATDPESEAITYHFVSGGEDRNNSLFTLDQNGTLKTAEVLDYEAGDTLSIRVQAKDEYNASREGNFTVRVLDVYEPSRPNHTVDLNSTVSLEMIWVEPGTFMMESFGAGETHEVTLTKGYYLGKYEVTQSQYQAVVNSNPSNFPGENKPVEYVSWGDARNFVHLLNQKEADNLPPGWGYVLPTEAEWEFACRAGTTTSFNWGNEIDATKANYSESGLGQTVEVGQYSPNNWGFYDMHGNAREWTADIYMDYSSNPQIDPTGGTSGDGRVTRGGFYGAGGGDSSSKHRNSRNLHHRHGSLGFRLSLQKVPHVVELNSTVSLEMIWVEPGTFTMGSPETEEGRGNDETQHEVTLTKGFYLGKYEVTQAQYEAVMTGNANGLSATPSQFDGYPNRPVEQVSYNDIQSFLRLLNEKEVGNLLPGWTYALPTEAQWEYACRAGTSTTYSWGSEFYSDELNFRDSDFGQHIDVGQYTANPWGFFDMHGNVWEWTSDWHEAFTVDDVVNPKGPSSGIRKVPKGGSAWSAQDRVRSAARGNPGTNEKGNDIGFRLAFKQVTQQEIDLNETAQNFYAYEQKPVGNAIGVFVTDSPDRGVSNKYSLNSNYLDESNFSIRGNILYSADVFDSSIQQSYEIGIDIENPDGYVTSEKINIWVAKDYSHRTMELKVYGKNLAGANLSGSTFPGPSTFEYTNLTDANLSRGNFTGLNFGSANLTGADLTDANFTQAWFNSNTVWPEGFDYLNSGAWGPGVDFSNRTMELKAYGKDLTSANLSGSTFPWPSKFEYSNLTDANLSGGNFAGLNFESANLTGADLTDANLSGAWFTSSTIWPEGFDYLNSGAWGPGVDFSNRTMELRAYGKDLSSVNLSRSTFPWPSKFEYTNLRNADLTEGNFSGLNFSNANLSGAKLDGADFTNATFNQNTNFTGAIYSSATIWPNGFDPVAAGAILNDPPGYPFPVEPLTVSENQPIGTVVGEFNATDPDDDTITFALVRGAGSHDNNIFTIDENGTLRLAVSLDYESSRTSAIRILPGIALNQNPGFEDDLIGWTFEGPENGSLAVVEDEAFARTGTKAVNLYRSGGGYVRLVSEYLSVRAGRTYEFSMDLRDYEDSMYEGDHFQLNNIDGTVSHGTPEITDIGNNWKRLTRRLTVDSDTQYKIHFAKFKPGDQYIDNVTVLDVTDEDEDEIPHYLENIGLAGYGNDPFFLIRVQARDEYNASAEGNFTVTLTNVNEPATGSVEILGTVEVGNTLTADVSSLSDPEGMSSLTFQWYRDAFPISGATYDQYTITQTDLDYSISVKVDYVDGESSNVESVSSNAAFSTDVTSGSMFFIKHDGSLWAMGCNSDGQLGDGTDVDKHSPVMIVPSGVIQVSSNSNFTLFVKEDGSLWGMGANDYGQLALPLPEYRTPQRILASGVSNVTTGRTHTLYIKDDGSLWGMGGNENGQLGDGTNQNRVSPVELISSGVKQAASFHKHSIVVMKDGSVRTAGHNLFGQLGDGSTNSRNTFVEVIDSGVIQVDAGSYHSIAITNRAIFGFGKNYFGQLGQEANATQYAPVNLGISSSAMFSKRLIASAGSDHTLYAGLDIKTMGRNDFGQGGTSQTGLLYDDPAQTHQSSNIVQVSCGYYTSYYLLNDFSLWGVGRNGNGQLGDGTNTDRNQPYLISRNVSRLAEAYSNSPLLGLEVSPPDFDEGGNMGVSVSQSEDLVAVGAYAADSIGKYNEGAVYLYKKESNGSVSFLQKVVAPDALEGDKFGKDVSLLGNVLVVCSESNGTGAAYIYKIETNESATFIQKLVPEDANATNQFGDSVSQSGDLLAVGAENSVFIYQIDGYGTATQLQEINAPSEAIDAGFSRVSLHGDSLMIGAPYEEVNYVSNSGAVYLYKLESNQEFNFIQKLIAHDQGNHDRTNFGFYIAQSDDFFAVGNNGGSRGTDGAVYIYRRENNGTATFQQTITTEGAEKSHYFWVNSLSGDLLLVGSYFESIEGNSGAGAAYLYRLNKEENATFLTKIISPSVRSSGFFGASVSLRNESAIIGSHYAAPGGRYGSGAAYIYNVARIANRVPSDLNTTVTLSTAENEPIGTVVGEFNATDPDGDVIIYNLVSGEGDGNNSLFTLDRNGTLKTAAILDYEAGDTLSIRVQAKDEYNAMVEGNFTVSVIDVFEDLDGDGIEDHLDDDMDGDGFSNEHEAETGSDPEDGNSTPLNYGLVAWYPFDGNASDMSGNGNDGTVYGATLGEDRNGEAGKAYEFDGVDDYIEVNYSSSVNTESFTISLWANPYILDGPANAAEGHYMSPITSRDDFPTRGFLMYKTPSGKWSMGVGNGNYSGWQGLVTQDDAVAKDWTHLAFTFASNHLTGYTKGIPFQSIEATLSSNTSRPLRIGAGTTESLSPKFYFNGSIDDVRIYNRALSEAEVQALYELEKPKIGPSNSYDWVERAPVSLAGGAMESMIAIDGELYFADGKSNSPISKYDLAHNLWTTVKELNLGLGGTSAVALDQNIYLIGGKSTSNIHYSNVYKFDTNTSEVTEVAPMLIPIQQAGTISYKGKIYIFGGYYTDNLSRAFVYSPIDDAWEELATMPTARRSPKVLLHNSRLWVIGGKNQTDALGGNSLATVESYDPASNSWQTESSLNLERAWPYAWQVNGKMYVAGGRDGNDYNLDSIEYYDTQTESWVISGNLPLAIHGGDAVVINDQIFFAGGSSGEQTTNYTPSDKVFSARLSNSDPSLWFVQTNKSSLTDIHAPSNEEFIITGALYASRYDSSSNELWSFSSATGAIVALSSDQAGNLYLSGNISSDQNWGGIAISHNRETDPFVGKMNSAGDWQWVRPISTSAWSSAADICTDDDGNTYITGYVYGSPKVGNDTIGGKGWYDAFLAKIDKDGNWQWAVSAGSGSGDFGNAVTLDSAGNVYWAGNFRNTVSFGSTTLTSRGGGDVNGGGDIFIAKLDSSGNFLWAKRAGSANENSLREMPTNLVTDAQDNVYLSGYISGDSDFGDLSVDSRGGQDGFLAKLNPSGDWQWVRIVGGSGDESISALEYLNDNTLVVAGSFSDNITLNNGTTLFPSANSDSYILTYNTSGELLDLDTLKNSGSINISSSTVNSDGNIIFGGTFTGDFNYANQTHRSADSGADKSVFALLYPLQESDNHPPTDLNTTAQITVKENGQAELSIGSFTAVDPDGDSLTFFLTEGEGDQDNQFFELSRGGSLITLKSFNFEEKAALQIRVAVSDGRGGQVADSFEVTIVDQNDFPTGLEPIGELKVQENHSVGTEVGQFRATDEDGDSLTFGFARGPGDSGNESFTLSDDGVLATAREFDFEEAESVSVRVSAVDGNGGSVSASFEVIIQDQFENEPPRDLNTTGVPSVAENREAGTVVTQFTAFDPDGDKLTFALVSGEGDADNGLFVLSENGQLTTASVLDFEEAATRSIRVQVADEHGESLSEKFTIRVIDHENEEMQLEETEFEWDGRAGVVGKLKVIGREDVTFGLGQDEAAAGSMHLFVIEDDGTLILAEDAEENNATFNLTAIILKDDEVLDKQAVTVQLTVKTPEDLLDVDMSDLVYHETALMIRDLAVVRDDQRNGHNPIVSIEQTDDGLIVTTAQPHGRKEGDSVVLSGVKGLLLEGIRNWNFMIDGVTAHSFRLLKFGKDANGKFDGSKGAPVSRQSGTQYQPSSGDFLLGQWTFGHLLGNMVSEVDDPVEFYRHFANQWKNVQTVNGWESDARQSTHDAMVPTGELTLANLPFRLLAIGNRIDLFHAQSIRKVEDAGEGRFVFTMTQSFALPQEDTEIWMVHEKTGDESLFTLIFEYGQPAADFATLAKWAKDWHSLQREEWQRRDETGKGFNFDDDYFTRLNELTDRFSKRGAHPDKPNGNPINQVRTNDFIGFTLWQMREYNLTSKEKAHQVKALPDRETKLVVDEELQGIDIGLWTTTTKNNPMVDSSRVEERIDKPLARWINQRESHILSADVGPRAPEWMEGPIANEPVDFSYKFESENIRTNLARYKYSLSTCSGCHTGDTGKSFQFQMVHSLGGVGKEAKFVPFMEGDGNGGMHVIPDRVNNQEKHEFFDLKAREEIARDILSVAREVDEARLRLTRTEIQLDGLEAPAHAFVSDGVIGDWQYDLPSGREDNDFYTLNASTGELSIRGNGQRPPFGKGRIFLRARATDGTGIVIERPYSLWVLSEGESRLMEDLDPSIEASDPPPLATPRPNRTH